MTDAFVNIKYRENWFFIVDTDVESKRTDWHGHDWIIHLEFRSKEAKEIIEKLQEESTTKSKW